MKGMYWKPQRASKVQRALIATLAVVGLLGVERLPAEERQPYYGVKIQAARKAREAMEVIKEASQKKRLRLQVETDPSKTAMVGRVLTPITSGSGALISKQTAVNPNFAAVIVQWLKELKLKVGDTVAIGVSGSFPGANLAVYSAVHEMGLRPIIVASVGASQWGANEPSFTWLDMEAALRKQGVLPYKAAAASRGGVGDDGIGLTKRGRRLLDKAIERNEVPRVGAKKGADEITLDDLEARPEDQDDGAKQVEERMRIYRQAAGGRAIGAYINVGGGTVSVGTKVGKHKFSPGVNKRLPRGGKDLPPSVIGAFLEDDVPAIHVTQIVKIAERYGLDIAPVELPDIGQGDVFQKRQPNRTLAGLVLLLILLALFSSVRAPWGTRILQKAATRTSSPGTMKSPPVD